MATLVANAIHMSQLVDTGVGRAIRMGAVVLACDFCSTRTCNRLFEMVSQREVDEGEFVPFQTPSRPVNSFISTSTLAFGIRLRTCESIRACSSS